MVKVKKMVKKVVRAAAEPLRQEPLRQEPLPQEPIPQEPLPEQVVVTRVIDPFVEELPPLYLYPFAWILQYNSHYSRSRSC